jgi:hypothetical protein
MISVIKKDDRVTYVLYLNNFTNESSIIDEDWRSDINRVRQLLVRAIDLLVIAVHGDINDDFQTLALLDLDDLIVSVHSSNNFWTFAVYKNRHVFFRLLLFGLVKFVVILLMSFQIIVSHVKSENVHAGVHHCHQSFRCIARVSIEMLVIVRKYLYLPHSGYNLGLSEFFMLNFRFFAENLFITDNFAIALSVYHH